MALEKFSTWIFYISVLLVIATMYTVAFVNRKELSVHEVLTNLAYDNITKTIFIGGENVLLKASENLAEHKRQATGPNLDYVDCYHDLGGTCAGENRNNVNKLLLIDSSKRRLIVCGSFNHGVCQIRSLDTLEVETNGTDYVVSSVPLQAEALITPSVKSSGTRAIYVATSWDKKYFKNPLNFLNPALSTRVIDELMNIFKPVKDDSSKSYIQYKENVVYYAKFIYAFSAGIFNYFVSVQQTTESYKKCNGACSVDQAIFKTFIVRVCQEDEVYASYMELPLDCKGSNGTSFNIAQSAYLTKAGDGLAVDGSEDVLVVTFFKADQGWSGPSQSSAVCIFSVKEIKTALVSNLKNCVNNAPDEEISLPWFPTHVLACEKEQSTPTITENFCPTSTFYAYHPFRGKTPLTKRSVMQYEKGMLTAVAAMPYYNHTVIFAGTDSGQLLKFSVEDEQQQVDPYSELKISSDEVRRIIVTSNQQHLYILSKHKVTKLPVEDCSTSESCDRCTKPNDPFCGWCTLYKRCSQKTSCPSADAHPLRYVTEPSNCPLFASISPEKVPHGPSIELTVKVSNVPPLAGLKCFVNGKEQKPTTVGPGNELKCQTPPEKDLPSITSDTGDVWVDLALYSTESQLLFLVKKLAFYSCPAIKGCINCAEGNYSCNWCTYLGRCTSNSSVDCQGEFIMPPQERAADSKGCPQIIADKSLFVPAQVNTSISVPAKNLPPEKGVASYKCVVTVDGSRKTSVAYRISDTELKCSPLEVFLINFVDPGFENSTAKKDKIDELCLSLYFGMNRTLTFFKTGSYFYKASIKKQEVKLEVIFRNSDVLYTPNTFKVYLYKCWVSITDCSSCHVEADADYQCGWCKSVSKCVVQKACGEGGAWIPPTSRCLTKPNISKVWPLTGPVTGGTEIEIHGSDLGKNFDNIKDSVMVAGMKCYPDQTKYQPSKRIFCNTSNSTGPLSGPVSVKVNKIEGKSKQLFSYQIPEPIDFNPKKGPRSGGTTVKIAGLKMNTGRHITAMVAGRKCVVDRAKVTNNSISCTISRAFSRRKRNAVNASTGVTVSFDGFTPTGPRGIFVFTPDPTVTSIEPDEVFFGGGLMLRISGTNLDTIQKPRMYLAYFSPNGTTKLNITVQECESKSSTLMECLSPKVPDFVGNVSKVQVQFLMDADIPLRSNYTSLTMIPNPFFEHFEDNLFVLKTENLILEGGNLQDELREQIFVTVGRLACKITSVDKTQLVCHVPSEDSHSPQATDGLYPVKVVVGYLDFPLGNLEYFKEEESKVIPIEVWIGVGGGVLLIFIIVVIIVCCNRRSRRKKTKTIKNLEVQMNNLESKVARECREAFAELQTDVTDLTSDLSSSGMPFLDFRMYALHVLFPGLGDHPVLHKNKGILTENWEKGLRQFSQLIFNKKFLLVFIRTLESQNTFQMKDRCNVASLLMVALQAKMEYATDILKELLCELIRKSVAKSHPKLLLRRTESVAEKMLTNWLAFCMYDFLKNDAGEPLFMLFKALKQQTEKGPVDAVTGEARYSLSEDKLLRQALEFKPLNVTVTYESNQPMTVSLLDCDTITQAKEKILDVVFKNSPYSSRSDKDDHQLEWEQSSGRVISLRDDDSKSLIEGEWRKINTLKDYEVTDGATLKLVTGQRFFCSSTDSELNKKNVLRVGFSPAGSYSPLAAMNTDGPDEGGKLWHLVKQMDYPADRAEDDHNSKFLSEIYLTRLLMTKGTLQQFVDRLFHTVFMRYRRGCSLPPAVKFLFDLLDTQARELNLSDPEVLHTWKNNSLPLRFWINIVKNPNFIFDVCKSAIVDSCLSVVAQLFMDSCSVSEHVLGKDSPSNKLLYAREIPGYRQDVERFYSDIQASPSPTPQELSKFFSDFSMEHGQEFNGDSALQELYDYVRKYQDQLQDALEESELSPLASKLEHVIATISDD